MANVPQPSSSSQQGILGYVPFIALVLIAAHVVALVYWMYKLATQKPHTRSKTH